MSLESEKKWDERRLYRELKERRLFSKYCLCLSQSFQHGEKPISKINSFNSLLINRLNYNNVTFEGFLKAIKYYWHPSSYAAIS